MGIGFSKKKRSSAADDELDADAHGGVSDADIELRARQYESTSAVLGGDNPAQEIVISAVKAVGKAEAAAKVQSTFGQISEVFEDRALEHSGTRTQLRKPRKRNKGLIGLGLVLGTVFTTAVGLGIAAAAGAFRSDEDVSPVTPPKGADDPAKDLDDDNKAGDPGGGPMTGKGTGNGATPGGTPGGNPGGTPPPAKSLEDLKKEADAAIIKSVLDWRNTPEDEVWTRVKAWIDAAKPELVIQAYVYFSLSQLMAPQAMWLTQSTVDEKNKVIGRGLFNQARLERGEALFNFGEACLTEALIGADTSKSTVKIAQVKSAIDKLHTLRYDPLTLQSDSGSLKAGDTYLSADEHTLLARGEKLRILHYVMIQLMRLFDLKTDIVPDLYYTLDTEAPGQYWTAQEPLDFSDLKVDDNRVTIVFRPTTVDVDVIDWAIDPGAPDKTHKDDSIPYYHQMRDLVDGTDYAISATVSYRSSPVLNAAAGKSMDRAAETISESFTVDNGS